MKILIILFLILFSFHSNSQSKLFYGGSINIGVSKSWYNSFYYEFSATKSKYTKALGFNIFVGRPIFNSFETFTKIKLQQFNSLWINYKFNYQTNTLGEKSSTNLFVTNYLLIGQIIRWKYKRTYVQAGLEIGRFINSKSKLDNQNFESISYSLFSKKYQPFLSFGGGYKVYSTQKLDINLGFNVIIPSSIEMKAGYLHFQIQKSIN